MQSAVKIGLIAVVIFLCLISGTTNLAADDNPLSSESIDKRIRQHRTAEISLTITDSSGKPAANTSVIVEMVRHRFLFGCNAFALGRCGRDDLNRQYADRFTSLLNYATLPFYWGSYEGLQGRTAEARLRRMAEWCRNNGIHAKGHPLCWHQVEPKWLTTMALETVEALQIGRISRDVSAFAGLIDRWDVVNEAVVMPGHEDGKKAISRLCSHLGQAGLIGKCFAEARKANPRAKLLLNDYVIDRRFEKLIDDCIEAGVAIDVIGIQSHMHAGYRGAKWVWETCEKFSRFGRPLHFTELTILSGKLKTDKEWNSYHPGWDSTPEGEKVQAIQTAEIYRVLFSHPAVEAITWWDFSDRNAWQGAPAGLLRKDMSPKPAYEALTSLIKGNWWTGPLKLRTDEAGKVAFRGFLGDYAIECRGRRACFELGRPGRERQAIRLPGASPGKTTGNG